MDSKKAFNIIDELLEENGNDYYYIDFSAFTFPSED